MGRVSSTQMTYNYLNQLNSTYTKYNKLFEQGDGTRLHRSSDDSVAYSKYLRYQNFNSANSQYQKNIDGALSWMKTSDSALTRVTDIITSITEKTVGAGNSTNTESDMKDIAKELLQGVREIVEEMNTQQGDRYLFAGQSDTVMPYMLSAKQMDRGEAKSLDERQIEYFGADATGNLTQFLVLTGSDNKEYYFDTKSGNVYDPDFVNEGYKKNVIAGITKVQSEDVVAHINVSPGSTEYDGVNKYFSTNGVINNDGRSWTTTLKDVNGNLILDSDGNNIDLTFNTVRQYVVNYAGDDKGISMVTQLGETKPEADTINITGQQVYGADIFDESSPYQTGTAMLNELLTVVSKIESGEYKWAGMDGIVVTDTALKSVINAQTTIAARYQAYEASQEMLVNQNELLTEEIGRIGSTDISKLAVDLTQSQTIYSLALAMGSKLFPGSLGDYL